MLESSQQGDRLAETFANAWLAGGDAPDLAEYLREQDSAEQRALLLQLVPIDLEHRWRRFNGTAPVGSIAGLPACPRLVDYAARFGEAFPKEAFTPELLAEESRVQRRWGGQPTFDQVTAVCEIFVEGWGSSPKPRIEEFLSRVPEESREMLFRNLLMHEISLRKQHEEHPSTQEYQARFPQYSGTIQGLFYEAVSTVLGKGTNGTSPPVSLPVASRLGNYQLLRELGRGGMGCVYEALNVQQNSRVALKTLPHVDGDRLHLFKREFRSLADVNHPNLVSLYTLEADGPQWFFTMEVMDGTDFLSHVRPQGVLEESRLRAVLHQTVTAVMALHANHIIHRDLKPSNVMVTLAGQVKVLDFGLVLEEDRKGSLTDDQILGTVRYMAPEQAAGQKVSAAADWYAVGVMLYEALVGRPPFAGPMLQVLQQKQIEEAPVLDSPDLPPDLVELCQQLLLRDPAARPDALALAKAVSSSPAVSSGGVSQGDFLVGRESQLADLAESFRSLREEQASSTAFVSGRSGEGKTSLVEAFLAPLRQDAGITVLSGRCYDRESVPFKALDSLIDALASLLRVMPERDSALLMPREMGLLAHVFPVLQRVEVVAAIPAPRIGQLDEQQVRTRAFAALRELLGSLSDRSPIVLFVDDLQWGDADSAGVLFELLRPPESPLVLFIGTFRSDEADSSPFLKSWKELQQRHSVAIASKTVQVSPLSNEQCCELVVSLVGTDNDRIRKRAAEFAEQTGGNPMLLTELVGCFDFVSDTVQVLPLNEVINQKMSRLSADAEPLLSIVAISGQALSMSEAAAALGLSAPPVQLISRMRVERLLRTIGDDDNPKVDTYHDKIRENVIAYLSEEQRRDKHLKLATVIEQQLETAAQLPSLAELFQDEGYPAIPRAYDLAYHFDAAGHEEKALLYAVLAAEQARRQFAPETATEQFAIALRNSSRSPTEVQFRIQEGYGESLMLLGRYDQSIEVLNNALELASTPEQTANIEALLGGIAFKRGDVVTSYEYSASGLRRLGVKVPKSLAGTLWGLFRELMVRGWHRLLPGRLFRKPIDQQARTKVAVHQSMRSVAFFDMPKFIWNDLAGLNQAELFVPSSELATSYALHANILGCIGLQKGAEHYGSKSLKMAQELNDVWGEGYALVWRGIACWMGARFEEAVENLTRAIECFQQAGDMGEMNFARFHLGLSYYGLGDLESAVRECRKTFESSVQVGDPRANCSLYLWSKATEGQMTYDDFRGCFTNNPEDILSTCNLHKGEGYWHLANGRTEEALTAFELAWSRPVKHRVLLHHAFAGIPPLVGALRISAGELGETNPALAKQRRKRAFRLAKRFRWIMRFFPVEKPGVLRELSLLYRDSGDKKLALKFAEQSCQAAESQQARYELAKSAVVRAELKRAQGTAGSDEELAQATHDLTAFQDLIVSAR